VRFAGDVGEGCRVPHLMVTNFCRMFPQLSAKQLSLEAFLARLGGHGGHLASESHARIWPGIYLLLPTLGHDGFAFHSVHHYPICLRYSEDPLVT